ncbi:MAG: hypothetical protein EOO91_06060 [Pedobacter sp.]|nr:MAG: hypothetical protein EOO91_06060 [Pedobacter sp.]
MFSELAFILFESTTEESSFGESNLGESILFVSTGAGFGELENQPQDVKDKDNAKAKKPNLNTFFIVNFF